MKYILGALAAVSLLIGVSAAQPATAQERCFWTGFGMECHYARPHFWWRHHYWHHPYWRDWD